MHGMIHVTRIDPAPADVFTCAVCQAFRVRPRFPVDHQHIVGECWSGLASPCSNHKHAITQYASWRINNKGAVHLAVVTKRTPIAHFASRACEVLVGAKLSGLEAQFARLAGRHLYDVFRISGALMHAIDDRRRRKQIVNADVDLSSLWDANQRPRHLGRLTFFGQGIHFHGGTAVRFWNE